MRGEDANIQVKQALEDGSPPHARGRRQWGYNLSTTRRITPACAGKTTSRSWTARRCWDHPRMRGEDVRHQEHRRVFQGSPPHARGRRGQVHLSCREQGITPACAGKTFGIKNIDGYSKDHPRMRGEDISMIEYGYVANGSPPHARGRLEAGHGHLDELGITPACAGKTATRPTCSSTRRDHPRMRGEDFPIPEPRDSHGGSPPHARGRRRRGCVAVKFNRITPACAGKTPRSA